MNASKLLYLLSPARAERLIRSQSAQLRSYASKPKPVPICPGCGSPVTTNPSQPGFIKSALSQIPSPSVELKKAREKGVFDDSMKALDKDVRDELLPLAPDDWQYEKPAKVRMEKVCTRCHSFKYHSGLFGRAGEKKPSNFDIFREIRSDPDCLVVNVIDIMDFPLSLLNLREHIGKRPHIIHVFNRIDVVVRQPKKLPGLVHRIQEMLRNQYASTPDEANTTILVVSALKGWHLDQLSDAIRKRRPGSNVYFTGSANAGKSSILGSLRRKEGRPDSKKYEVERMQRGLPVTSHIPGTTLGAIALPMFAFPSLLLSGREKGNLVDLPGVLNRGLSQYIELDRLGKALPHKLLRPKLVSLTPGKSMVLGGIIQITLLSLAPDTTSGAILVSNYTPLQPHSIKQPTTSRPDHIIETQPGVAKLVSPHKDDRLKRSKKVPPMEVAWEQEVECSAFGGGANAVDFVFQDIGYISVALFKGTAKIQIKTPGGGFVCTRQPLLQRPYDYK